MPARLPRLGRGEVPSGVVEHTQWGTIQHPQPRPPRHTLCAPMALLERFSYANEAVHVRHSPPLTSPPRLFLPQNSPNSGLYPILF